MGMAGWNCNSLGPIKSQRRFIRKIRGRNDNIIILIDTRLGRKDEEAFRKVLGERVFLHSSSKRGIAVLIKDSAPVTDLESENVIPGNFSKLSMVIKGKKVLLKCIYAPNEDSKPNDPENESTKFFNTIMDDTDEEAYAHKFTVGDFNVAPNHDTDTVRYLHINNPNSRELLNRKINLCNLVDIWRERNPLSRQYTFNKK